VQGTCVLDTGCRGARLLVWLILNDRVQPSFIAGVLQGGGCVCAMMMMAGCAAHTVQASTAANSGSLQVGACQYNAVGRKPYQTYPQKPYQTETQINPQVGHSPHDAVRSPFNPTQSLTTARSRPPPLHRSSAAAVNTGRTCVTTPDNNHHTKHRRMIVGC